MPQARSAQSKDGRVDWRGWCDEWAHFKRCDKVCVRIQQDCSRIAAGDALGSERRGATRFGASAHALTKSPGRGFCRRCRHPGADPVPLTTSCSLPRLYHRIIAINFVLRNQQLRIFKTAHRLYGMLPLHVPRATMSNVLTTLAICPLYLVWLFLSEPMTCSGLP